MKRILDTCAYDPADQQTTLSLTQYLLFMLLVTSLHVLGI